MSLMYVDIGGVHINADHQIEFHKLYTGETIIKFLINFEKNSNDSGEKIYIKDTVQSD